MRPNYVVGILGLIAGGMPPMQQIGITTAPNYLATDLSGTVGTTTRWESRRPFYIAADCSELVPSFCNDYATRAGLTAPNQITIASYAIEKGDASLSVPVTFGVGASRSLVMNGGDTDIQANTVYPSAFGLAKFTKGELYWERIVYELPSSTSKYPLTAFISQPFTGFNVYKMDTSVAATADGTGPLVGTGKTAVTSGKTFAAVILGRPIQPGVRMFINTNSSTDRDADTTGAWGNFPLNLLSGIFERSMLSNDGTDLSPFINTAVFGTRISPYDPATDRRRAYYKYATDLVEGYGNNDVATVSVVDLKAALTSLWSTYKTERPTGRIWRNKFRPDVTSTDGYATYENQVIGAGSQPGGTRVVMNAWFDDQRATGTLEGVIPHGRFRNPSNFEQVRIGDGTEQYYMIKSDNTHPTSGVGFPALGRETRSVISILQSSVPAALSGVSVQASDQTITAVWTKPSAAPSDYIVEISPAGANTWTSIHTYDDAPVYCWTGLSASTSYDIRITPVNYNGSGPAFTYTISTSASPSSLLLNGFATTPSQALSSRRLSSTYTGPLYYVRRRYDQLEAPVYWDASGNIDSAFLLAWANGDDVVVKRAFDQSGSANHANASYVSTNSSLWPRTVAAGGALQAVNGRTTVRFDGTHYISNSPLNGNPANQTRSVVAVFKHDATTPTSNRSIVAGGANSFAVEYTPGQKIRLGIRTSSDIRVSTLGVTAGDSAVVSATYDGANGSIWINGVLDGTTAVARTFTASGTVAYGVGNNGDAGGAMYGYIPERILWDAVPSTSDRQAAEESAKAYWGTP